MQCCAAGRATWQQQQTPKLGMEGGRGRMWIFLFSKVTCTPLKDKVSTIFLPIVGMEKNVETLILISNSNEYNILFYSKTLTLPVANREELPPPPLSRGLDPALHFYTLSETKWLETPPLAVAHVHIPVSVIYNWTVTLQNGSIWTFFTINIQNWKLGW